MTVELSTKMCARCGVKPTATTHPNSKYCLDCGDSRESRRTESRRQKRVEDRSNVVRQCQRCAAVPPRTSHPNCRFCASCAEEVSRFRNLTSADRERHLAQKREYAKLTHRKIKYGVSHAEFQRVVHEAGNRCKFCNEMFEAQEGSRGPHLDHCHNTGRVRGVLCGPCNRDLGVFEKLMRLNRLDIMRDYLQAGEVQRVA